MTEIQQIIQSAIARYRGIRRRRAWLAAFAALVVVMVLTALLDRMWMFSGWARWTGWVAGLAAAAWAAQRTVGPTCPDAGHRPPGGSRGRGNRAGGGHRHRSGRASDRRERNSGRSDARSPGPPCRRDNPDCPADIPGPLAGARRPGRRGGGRSRGDGCFSRRQRPAAHDDSLACSPLYLAGLGGAQGSPGRGPSLHADRAGLRCAGQHGDAFPA